MYGTPYILDRFLIKSLFSGLNFAKVMLRSLQFTAFRFLLRFVQLYIFSIIIRDYDMGFWLFWLLEFGAVSTRVLIIRPESFSSSADNSPGLILRRMTKTPCYKLFITYLNRYFK